MKNIIEIVKEKVKDGVKEILVNEIKKKKKIFIGDTTLRDGEQAPGASLSVDQKLTIAGQLDRLGVDSIEAGFPASSKEEFEAVKLISKEIRRPVISALCRSRKEDIDSAKDALAGARRWGVSLFLGVSPMLRKYSLGKSKDQVIETIKDAIKYARNFTDSVAFGPEDASRTEPDFLYRVYEVAIASGALVVGFPDTVGCLVPDEVKEMISGIKRNVPNIEKSFLAVHFHNDLGLAVANTLAAVQSGVSIVQCTVNGIGERAGNTSLEEVCMALITKKDFYKAKIGIDTRELFKTSKLVSRLTGLSVSANKPIVGENVFATEAGIHQAALLKKETTYEIIKPGDVGQSGTRIVLGRHSGKHAIENRLRKLGHGTLLPARLERIYNRFKEIAVTKKEVSEEELSDIAKKMSQK